MKEVIVRKTTWGQNTISKDPSRTCVHCGTADVYNHVESIIYRGQQARFIGTHLRAVKLICHSCGSVEAGTYPKASARQERIWRIVMAVLLALTLTMPVALLATSTPPPAPAPVATATPKPRSHTKANTTPTSGVDNTKHV